VSRRPRAAARVALLALGFAALAGAALGAAACDACRADCAPCDQCVLCCPAARRAGAVALSPAPASPLGEAAGDAAPVAGAPRAIEHVPLARG
jgi:hypothetical protein